MRFRNFVSIIGLFVVFNVFASEGRKYDEQILDEGPHPGLMADEIVVFKSRKNHTTFDSVSKGNVMEGDALSVISNKKIIDKIEIPPGTWIRSVNEGDVVKMFLKRGRGGYYPIAITSIDVRNYPDDSIRIKNAQRQELEIPLTGVLQQMNYPTTSCHMGSAYILPMGTQYAISPNVYQAILNWPQVGGYVLNGMSAWNNSAANGRLAGWSNIVSASTPAAPDPECPSNRGYPLVSAFSFSAPTTTSCPAANKMALSSRPGVTGAVDLTPEAVECEYPACGTKSVMINLDHAWATTPELLSWPGYIDIQATLAHEFGHALGFVHNDLTNCNNHAFPSPKCSPSNGGSKTTMSNVISPADASSPADTCQRDIELVDQQMVNAVYP